MSEYNFQEIETKWQKYWEEQKTFKTDLKNTGDNKCYILDMFPYPSGSGLHMGHPLGYTGTDIYSRFKKLQGYDVLHPMGFDAFGLPAEQHAIKTGNHPAEFTKKNCETFKSQMKKLGLCYDWDREIATCDEGYYKWTQWIFIKLYNSWFDEEQQKARPIEELNIPAKIQAQGKKAVYDYQSEHRLAYMAEAMVNWCPELGTVLANEEVINGKSEVGGFDVVQKPMRQWQLRITKYSERLLQDLKEIDWPEHIKIQQVNWIGKSYGSEVDFPVKDSNLKIKVYTTRIDTIFSGTFVILAPEHPLLKELLSLVKNSDAVKKYIEQAALKTEIDRTAESNKTGVCLDGLTAINPATNEEIQIWVSDFVLAEYGTGAVFADAHDERDFEMAKKYRIPLKVSIQPENDEGLLQKIKSLEVCYTEEGILFNSGQFDGLTSREAKIKITEWLEDKGLAKATVKYKLRDWLFSRQRYWGEPIPVIHWEDGTVTSLNESELPLVLPEVSDYKPADTGESPLAKAGKWLEVTCPETGKKGKRETNTMPQWAGSCWYYLRFIDPQNNKKAWNPELEKSWMPVDLYVGGAEHAVLHLLYARFWHKVLFDLGYVSTNEPFQKLFNQGMLVSYAYKDSRGALVAVDEVEERNEKFIKKETGEEMERIMAKMSKSLRNVVTPDEIIAEYGADTLRTFLMFMAPLEAQKSWDSKAINGVHRFLRKAYNFITTNSDYKETEDEDVTGALHALIKKVTEDLENLRFNTPISSMMEFLNTVFDKKVSADTIKKFIILLSTYAPHLAEELWQQLGEKESIFFATWPKYDPALLEKTETTVVVQVKGKKRATLEVPIDIDEAALKQAVIQVLSETAYKVQESDKFIIVSDKKTNLPKLVNVIM